MKYKNISRYEKNIYYMEKNENIYCRKIISNKVV